MAQVRRISSCTEYRAQLDTLALPKGRNVPEHKKFFCASHLRHLFSSEALRELLRCPCDRCSLHRRGLALSQGHIKHAIEAIVAGVDRVQEPLERSGSARATYHISLGLFLYIDAPALVISLAHQSISDTKLLGVLDGLGEEQIRIRFWPMLPLDRSVSVFIARRLRGQRHHFFLPSLSAGKFDKYAEDTLLPFYNETKIGVRNDDGTIQSEGSYGDIYAIEIPAEYHDFTTRWSGKPHFVRKELRGNNSSAIFHAEYTKLDYIRKIKDDHIITILKAYQHGDKCNIIFPRAKTNLNHYLRDARWDAPTISASNLQGHSLWREVDGLARGLAKILNYEAEDESRFSFLYGYHFDLKPANILIFHEGRCVISDFGQAHFKKGGTEGSKVIGLGGTESYAPPEYDDNGTPCTRKYDIFSLGCIFLEIVTFIVLGHEGVRTLDALRVCRSTDAKVDDRFVVQIDGAWSLKPAITSWMESLVQKAFDGTSRDFLREVISLIQQMLSVTTEQRCDSKTLCYTLSKIFNYNPDFKTYKSAHLLARPEPSLDTQYDYFDVGNVAIASIEDLKFHYERSWRSGKVKLSHRRHELFLCLYDSNQWKYVPCGDISELRMVPLYALHDNTQHRFQGSSIYLQNQTISDSVRLPCEQFYSTRLTDIIYFQEALLGQIMSQQTKATRVTLHAKSENKSKSAMRVLSLKSRACDTIIAEESEPIIQFWTEGHRAPKDSSSATHQHAPEIHQFSPAARRVVIFGSRSTHVIRIDDKVRLTDSIADASEPRTLRFCPAKLNLHKKFGCMTIQSDSDSGHASLPLSWQTLQHEEERNSCQLTSVELDFGTPQALENFRNAYRTLKYNWELDRKNCSRTHNQAGLELGFAPNAL